MKDVAKNIVTTGTYISKTAIKRLFLKKNIQMIIGGFWTVFFLYAIIEGLLGNNEILRNSVLTSTILCVPFVLMFLAGIRNGKKIGVARRYNSIFMCDSDGTVTLDELVRQTGKEPFKVLSELEWLFRKGMFCDCTLQKGGIPCVILAGKEGSKSSFVTVVCEKCNGTTRLRAGTYGKCEYCGSAISSRKINQ